MIRSWRSPVVARLAAIAQRAPAERLCAFTLTVVLSRLRFGDHGVAGRLHRIRARNRGYRFESDARPYHVDLLDDDQVCSRRLALTSLPTASPEPVITVPSHSQTDVDQTIVGCLRGQCPQLRFRVRAPGFG